MKAGYQAMEAVSVVSGFTLAFLLTVTHTVSGSEDCNGSAEPSAKRCTTKTESIYERIVDEIIAGNDSGVPQLCRSYDSTVTCLNNLFESCGTEGRLQFRQYINPLQDTVGRYCDFHREKYGGKNNGDTSRSRNAAAPIHKRGLNGQWSIYLLSYAVSLRIPFALILGET